MSKQFSIDGRVLARNSILNLFGQGLPLLVAFFAIPRVIRGLGAEQFAIVTLAWVLLDYFSLFDLGLGRAATKFVAEALGRGESETVRATTWNAITAQALLGGLAGLVLVALIPALIQRVLHASPAIAAEARWSFYVLAVALPLGLISSSLRGALEAAQRFDLVNAVRTPFGAANFLVPLVAVWFHLRLPTIVALLVLSRGMALAIYFVLCSRVFPGFVQFPGIQTARLRTLLNFGGWVTVSAVIGPVLVYLDRFLISALLSLAAVTYYAAPYEMVTRLWIIPTSLVATLFPALTTLGSMGDVGKTRALTARCIKYLLMMLGPAIILIIVFGHDLLQAWLGADFATRSTTALQILAAGVLVNSLANVPTCLLLASGRPDIPAKFHLIELPVHALVTWLLVKHWGISGAALAWFLRMTLDALLLFVASVRFLPEMGAALRVNRVPTAAAFVVCFAFLATLAAILPTGLWARLTLTAVELLASGAVAWWYVLDSSDRAHVAALVGRLERSPA